MFTSLIYLIIDTLTRRSTAYWCLLLRITAESGASGMMKRMKYLIPRKTTSRVEKVTILLDVMALEV
jgi:hypothetical protein